MAAVSLLAAALFAGTSCSGRGGGDPVILSLGEEVVRRSDFERHVAALEAGGGERINPGVLPSLLDTFLEERVLVLEARARGLVKAGAAPEDEQAAVQQLLQDQVLKETEAAGVPEGAIAAYYDGHPAEFSVAESVTLRQILVATENEARDVRRRLAKDPKTFEALARVTSRGPEAASGGLMGTFSRAQLPVELEAAAFSVPVGGLSDVIRSSLGYHVLRVDARVEARTASREESEGRIRGLLLREASDRKTREFVSELMARAKVNHEAAVLPSRRP